MVVQSSSAHILVIHFSEAESGGHHQPAATGCHDQWGFTLPGEQSEWGQV